MALKGGVFCPILVSIHVSPAMWSDNPAAGCHTNPICLVQVITMDSERKHGGVSNDVDGTGGIRASNPQILRASSLLLFSLSFSFLFH